MWAEGVWVLYRPMCSRHSEASKRVWLEVPPAVSPVAWSVLPAESQVGWPALPRVPRDASSVNFADRLHQSCIRWSEQMEPRYGRATLAGEACALPSEIR